MSNKQIKQVVEGNENVVAGGDIDIHHLTINQVVKKLPSLLSKALPALAEIALGNQDNNQPLPEVPYEIQTKINHNDLQVYSALVREYNEYGNAIDTIYESVDDSKPLSKRKIFRYLSGLYLQRKSHYISQEKFEGSGLTEIDTVRKYSDKIFGEVVQLVEENLKIADLQGILLEDLNPCSQVIVAHGFINCKVLERTIKA